MRELEGKIALVTGASRGIGLSTAKLLTEKVLRFTQRKEVKESIFGLRLTLMT